MGLISAMLGNASEIDPQKIEKEFENLLIEGEEIRNAFKMFRDLIVFTNLRLFLVDKQGITGKKREYLCVPYDSVDYFSKETAGTVDIDAEIKIWIKSREQPFEVEFKKDDQVHEVFRTLSYFVLTKG